MQCVNARGRKHKVWSGHRTQTMGRLRKGIPENLQEARFRQQRWLRSESIRGQEKHIQKKGPEIREKKKKKSIWRRLVGNRAEINVGR